MDGNGLLDVLTGGDDDGLHVYSQEAPLQFRQVDAELGLENYNEGLYGILTLDFDRDGDTDIVLNQVGFGAVGSTPSLRYLRNQGNGRFLEFTTEAGFHEFAHGFSLAALDYDHDGWMDLYVINHRSNKALYRNLGDGTFENVTAAAGVAGRNGRLGDSCGVATLDYDRDGWVDIFVPQRDNVSAEFPYGNNLLYHNQGDGTFVNRAVEAGVAGYGCDFVASAADFNNDGWTDISIGAFNFGMNGYPETDFENSIYLNRGDGTFLDISGESGMNYIGGTMGLAADDADNDGAPDLFVGNGGPFPLQIEETIFYRGLGDGTFVRQTIESGLLSYARGHGPTWLDIDRDGDLDLFASLGGMSQGAHDRDLLFINTGPTGRGLEVVAQGVDCPLEGVGVTVEAFANDLHLRREIDATGGFDSHRPPMAWFGVGTLTQLDSLVLHWPCGRRQRLLDVATNDHIQVLEADAMVGVLDFEWLAERSSDGSVKLELHGDIAALQLDSVELSRRVAKAGNWLAFTAAPQVLDGLVQWTDPNPPLDQELAYRLQAQFGNGLESVWLLRESELGPALASRLWLSASPNPFRHAVGLRVPLLASQPRLHVYDARGRTVRTLESDQAIQDGVSWLWNWNGLDSSGRAVARGVYMVELQSTGEPMRRRIVKLER